MQIYGRCQGLGVKVGFYCCYRLTKHYILGLDLDPVLKLKGKVRTCVVQPDRQRHGRREQLFLSGQTK